MLSKDKRTQLILTYLSHKIKWQSFTMYWGNFVKYLYCDKKTNPFQSQATLWGNFASHICADAVGLQFARTLFSFILINWHFRSPLYRRASHANTLTAAVVSEATTQQQHALDAWILEVWWAFVFLSLYLSFVSSKTFTQRWLTYWKTSFLSEFNLDWVNHLKLS